MTDQNIETQDRPITDLAKSLYELSARTTPASDADLIQAAAKYVEGSIPPSELPVPEYDLAHLGGNCPVQAEGVINGKSFYYRARWDRWSLSIGADPIGAPEWTHVEICGAALEAGWMEEDEAKEHLERALALYAAGRPGAQIPPVG
ncbi:hypothetical protein ACGYLO_12380 [Sulfitobacter sp. 1A13353]|uniref:hypothetical protein n=1 Tax=Sulfitobacter sp. 1A13353 TaxID=3368568 RepID=UPI003744EF2E